ncbi:hypothetical protein [Aquidulcibacter sp.]|uniref:hypothetical protein n=1 Tax=Aquidulcibacter sp. TaxID=2052990 RepID=UPI003BA8206E
MNLRGWRGIQEIRDALHAEGFQVDRVYAELNAAICEAQFSPAEFLAEQDNVAYSHLSGVRVDGKMEWEPEPPRPILTLRDSFFAALSQADRNRLIEGPILERRIAELQFLPSNCAEYVMSNAEIREFALKVAKSYGFKKIKARFGTIAPVIAKEDAETGVKVFFGLDGDSRAGRFGLVRRLNFDMRLYVTDGPLDSRKEIEPALFGGMGYYRDLNGLLDPSYGYDAQDMEQMKFWSEIIKIGIVALVRFLDLFHASIVKFRKEKHGLV